MEKINSADTEAMRCFEVQRRFASRARITNAALLFLLSVAIIFAAIWVWVAPQKSFSENENRYLRTRGDIDLKSSFFEIAEQISGMYADQFLLRDKMITAKAIAELALLKGENNGVLVRGGALAARSEYSLEEKQNIIKNISAIEKFSNNVKSSGANVVFALAPRSVDVLFEDFCGAEAVWQLLRDTEYIDFRSAIKTHNNEYVWFKTDHHWTSLGAYYVYCELSGALGYEALPISDFEEVCVSEEFFGTAWSKSGAYWSDPDRINAFFAEGDESYYIYDEEKEKQLDFGLYDAAKLSIKDKYSFFLGGDHGHIKISNGAEKPRLIVVKDSYFNSVAPFLCRHFELDVIDLRYFTGSVFEYAKEQGAENILVLCGLDSLACAPTFTGLLYKTQG